MKKNKQELDAIIENATRSIRDEELDPTIMSQSAARVWEQVSRTAAQNSSFANSYLENSNAMNPNNNSEQIRGCADFQSLIPAYLEGKLSQARTLLLEDHSNECIPCRRELKAQRADAKAPAAIAVKPARAAGSWSFANAFRWAVPVAAVVVLAFVGMFMYERLDLSGRTLAATVESADGLVYVMSDDHTRPLAAGEELQKGERVRTAKDSHAVLKLADGSSVEMRERSEFSVSENTKGVTVNLERGDVIVEAAKQDKGRLYVQTPDSLVSVKGTIFAVESGTKGSRVSVVEGEVKVDHAGKEETLLPGDQTTTSPNLDKTSVQKGIAWSRKAAAYAKMATDLAKLQRDLNQRVQRPGVRYASKFMEIVPENTVFFAALPNLSESLAESRRVMQERIKQNPALAEWWKGHKNDGIGMNDQTLARVQEFGSHLGEEIVVTGEMNEQGEPTGILVLAEVKDPAAFRTYVAGEVSRLTRESGNAPNIRMVDDPMATGVAAAPAVKTETVDGKRPVRKEELFVWINGNTLSVSPQIETLRSFANNLKSPEGNRFASSSLHQRIADVYREGAGLVVAADLEKIVAKTVAKDKSEGADRRAEGLRQLGVMNLKDFVVEQKDVKGKTLSRAALTFTEANRGIASWLAAPGPMGALDFVSPNANVATAFVVKEPVLLVDDLLAFIETVDPDVRQKMKDVEKSQGIDIRNDFAAPLGGEFAFAIDGPLLPTPSWKIILEVYDQAKLQSSFERAIERMNQFSALHGKGRLAIESAASGDRTFYSVTSDLGVSVFYTFDNGYFIAAPSRALLEQSIRNREAGNTLVRSARFMSSLPQDGNANFSAIFYHDLAPLMQALGDKLKTAGGSMSEQDRQKIASIDANAPPTLAYAYSQGDRITIAANTEGGAFGLSPSSLIGMPNSFEMQHILMNAMGDKDVKKSE